MIFEKQHYIVGILQYQDGSFATFKKQKALTPRNWNWKSQLETTYKLVLKRLTCIMIFNLKLYLENTVHTRRMLN